MRKIWTTAISIVMMIIASAISAKSVYAQSSPTPTPTPDWSGVPTGYACYAPVSSFVYIPGPPSAPERIWRYPLLPHDVGYWGVPYYTGPAYVLSGRGHWGYWENGVSYSPFWSAPIVHQSVGAIPDGAVFYIGVFTDLPAGEYPPGDGAILCFPDSRLVGTATPYPSPTPTPTPTTTPSPTPTPTPDLVLTQVAVGQTAVAAGTPPAWCGYVPTHPCWVAYATQSALEDLLATVAARASSDAPQAVEVVNFPTPIPTATPEMAQYRQTATAVLAQPNPVPYSGGDIEYDSTDLGAGAQFWRVRLYDFGCPINVTDPWQVRICVRYHHIEQLRILPEPLPAIDPVIFIGALALLVVRWFVQR